MDICIVGSDLNPPFVEAQKNLAIELSMQLSMEGHTVHIVTESSPRLPCEEKRERIYFHRYPRQLFPLIVAHGIKKLNQKYGFDVIQNQNLTIHKSCMPMAALCKKLGVPTIAYVCLQPSLSFENWLYALRNDPREALMRMKEITPRFMAKLELSLVDKIVTSSNFLREKLVETLAIERNEIEVIHPFVDVRNFSLDPIGVETIRRKLCVDDTTRLLLFIGTHWVFRGEKDFLEAFSMVLEKYSDVKAVLVTPSPIPRPIVKLIRKLRIEKSLIFLSGGSAVDMPSIMAASDAYVFCGLSSVGGGSIDPPLTVIEAMVVGTPCIAYDTGGIQELADNKRISLVDWHNTYELANTITDVLQHKDVFEEREAGKLVERMFDSKIATRHFISIYEKIANR